MTFSYSDPSTIRRDALRLLVGDTSTQQVLLQDEEYDYLSNVAWAGEENDYMMASYCAEVIASKFAREINITSDSQTVGASELQEKYLRLATQLRTMAKTTFPGSIAVGGLDPWEGEYLDVVPMAFGTQMHDNIAAGRQDYGDQGYPDDWLERWGWSRGG